MQIKQYIINFFSKGHKRSIKAKKNILYSFLLKGMSILIGLVYVPLLIDYLDKERYGVWLTISSILMWFTFFDIGFGNGLRNKLAIAIANKKTNQARKYVSTTYAYMAISFFTLIIIFYFINPFLQWNKILNTALISKEELNKLMIIVFSFFMIRFIFDVVGKIYLAHQRTAMNNLINPLSNFISLLIILLLVHFSIEGKLIILGTVLSTVPVIVLLGFSVFAYTGDLREIRPSFKYIDFSLGKDLMGLGIKFFFLQVASIVMFSTANIIITQIFSPEEVTRYNIAFRYFQVPIMLYAIINKPIWSAVTDAYSLKDYKWLKNTLRKMNLLSIIFSLGIIIMFFLSGPVLKFWIGDRIDIPQILLMGMSLFAIISVFSQPFTAYINGFGKLKLSNYLVIFSLTGMIPLAIYLSKSISSSVGVIFAICIINVTGLIFKPIQIRKIITNRATGIWRK